MKRLALLAVIMAAPAPAHQVRLSEVGQPQSASYRLSGAVQIRPSLIWDDGVKTYLDWPKGTEAPAIFAIDASGGESLVNCYLRDGRYVIDDVFGRLIFRLDRLSARADRKAKERP